MKTFRLSLGLVISVLTLFLGGCSSSTATPWQNYPHLFTTAADRPFVVLMCKFADVSDEPAGLIDATNRFLTIGGVGQGNMVDYYSDVSYGAVSLAGNRVIMKWYQAPFTQTSLAGAGNRTKRVQQCANAVPPDDVDFSRYYGIIIVTNKLNDGGACYDGPAPMQIHNQTYNLACVVFDPYSLFTGFAAHEIGHGLGMPHSWDDSPCEYCDPWDIMSALGTWRFVGANFPDPYGTGSAVDGPGLNVPNLLQMGWIPQPIPTYSAGQPTQTFKLAALSHPKAPGDLTVKIVPNLSQPNDLYTVEYRQQDGWDAGIPQNTVLIHEYKQGSSPYSYLQRNTTGIPGEWLPPLGWVDPSNHVQVCVRTIDPTAGNAIVTIGTPNPFGCSSPPHVKIQAPVSGSHVTAGAPFQLVASATNYSGADLPDADVTWKANGTLGTGKTLTTSIGTPGTYTVTVTGTDPSNSLSDSDSIILYVDLPSLPPPQAKPTVTILSPTNGTTYRINGFGSSFTLALSSQASAGVSTYLWSDSLHMFTDTHANDTLTLTPSGSQVPCGGASDVITLKGTDNHGQTASASVTIAIQRVCIN